MCGKKKFGGNLIIVIGEDLGSSLGLEKSQTSVLKKVLNGIFEYAKFKVDPHGHKALTTKVNQLFELTKLINSPTIKSFIKVIVDDAKERALTSTPRKSKSKS